MATSTATALPLFKLHPFTFILVAIAGSLFLIHFSTQQTAVASEASNVEDWWSYPILAWQSASATALSSTPDTTAPSDGSSSAFPYSEGYSRKLQQMLEDEEICQMSPEASSHAVPVLLALKPSRCATRVLPVFRYPPVYVQHEAAHFIKDGLRKSDCFSETDLPDESNIWIYERHNLVTSAYTKETCQSLTELVQDRITRQCPEGIDGCEMLKHWKIIQVDYNDGLEMDLCLNLTTTTTTTLSENNLIYFRRSMIQNRTESRLGEPCTYSQEIRHVPYGVRSDIVLEVHRYMSEAYNLTLPSTTKTPFNPVYLPRPVPVRYMWWLYRSWCRGDCQCSQRRFNVSQALLEYDTAHPNTSIIGPQGQQNFIGRRFAQPQYVEHLLKTQIVVVAQRDSHEDMYRLMEAMAGGALVLVDRMLMPPKLLVNGRHFVFYEDMDDLQRKVEYYLSCSVERLKIAELGWTLVMQEYRSFHLMEKIILQPDKDL